MGVGTKKRVVDIIVGAFSTSVSGGSYGLI